jgi:hypothetical protein
LPAAGVLSVAFLIGCATAGTGTASVPAPAPCADALYADLRAQPPDSLSEREWQRLQALDRECAAARAEAPRTIAAQTDAQHHRVWWMASGLVMVGVMVLMMGPW